MGKKPRPASPRPAARIPVAGNERVRVEVEFDKPQLLVPLFGQYDQNLIALEGQLGVYISARGNRVQIEGEADGRTKRSRSMLEFKHGTASLTGLSVVLALASILGLNDRSPARPGLYLPELLLDPKWFLDELRSAGATIYEYSK